jgi:hypothetical protein
MSPTAAWIFLIVGYVLPLFHVLVSSRSGPWTAPEGARCPIGPRWGWVVIVSFLGPVGWLMYMGKRRAQTPRSAERPPGSTP